MLSDIVNSYFPIPVSTSMLKYVRRLFLHILALQGHWGIELECISFWTGIQCIDRNWTGRRSCFLTSNTLFTRGQRCLPCSVGVRLKFSQNSPHKVQMKIIATCTWTNSGECLFSQTVLSCWCLYRLGWCARDWTTRATSATGATAAGRRSAAAITMNCGVSIPPCLSNTLHAAPFLLSRLHTRTPCAYSYWIALLFYLSKITCLIGFSYLLLALKARRTCAASGSRLLACKNNSMTQTECVSLELFAFRLTNQNDMWVEWPLPHTAGCKLRCMT